MDGHAYPAYAMNNSTGTPPSTVVHLTRGKQQALIWLEARKLAAYETPYKHSYAVVVAIDDYDRKHDPNHRPPTGYPALSAMVSNAKTLVETLQKLGFEREHIVSLYDERATSDAVEAALKSFWPGGPTADADRVLFYFGGQETNIGMCRIWPPMISTRASRR
jgi:hypothetical protein